MATSRAELDKEGITDPGIPTSTSPLLESRDQVGSQEPMEILGSNSSNGVVLDGQEQDVRSSTRRFWGLGKKRENVKGLKKEESAQTGPSDAVRPSLSMQSSGGPNTTSSSYTTSTAPASPGRNIQSTSPRLGSPASSQIFERNVQEDGLYNSASPAIPAHITTENHIPSVLDASSVAITDGHLNPDNVEIVMHAAHQPAAMTVTGGGISEATGASWPDDSIAHPDSEDAASNYGALDANDVHRLSFISFADVVHAEHVDHSSNRDSTSSPPSTMPLATSARSPSPMRSPILPQAIGGSPPPSTSTSFRGVEGSPNRGTRIPGSPRVANSPSTAGELTIETMRQALRKTGSGDLSGVRCLPSSAVALDERSAEPPVK